MLNYLNFLLKQLPNFGGKVIHFSTKIELLKNIYLLLKRLVHSVSKLHSFESGVRINFYVTEKV